ncbi:MAG TPA: DUF4389 domain-containing protein [Conexibacter sp.]|nr:DUF4389 domain-containing protein [Conexibacter sp.]
MYPVAYEADYVEQRSRLTTFFRLILVIPWAIVGIFWGLAALVAVVIAWFAIVFTGRYPQGLYDLAAKALHYYTRVNSFALLMTDAWPSFGGDEDPQYPVRAVIAPPLPEYSRWKTLLRIFLLIPIVIVLYFVQLVSRAISVLAWLVIVVTGRLPRGIFDVMRFTLAYETRATAYEWLMTETYPPFSPDDEAVTTPTAPVAPPPVA